MMADGHEPAQQSKEILHSQASLPVADVMRATGRYNVASGLVDRLFASSGFVQAGAIT
ncbi:MAG: hypothetical protein P4L55_17025 [Syntrophobacteraceae bacterium]|nr:hypothetical protein [Syntrophobacteraceae bacterium]MDR3675127.1 hypothetical protein [Acidobacteriota bacterium]